MGKMFGNLTSTENLEKTEDRVGGAFEAVPSDYYEATIKLAYAGKAAKSDASNITFHFDLGGREVRETIYFTKKTGENFYVDKNDPTKRHPLPGFTVIDDICLLVTGESLTEQETEEKVVKIYNFDERKEVNTPAQCLVALHGQKIGLGILREIVDKESKDSGGVYQPTGETRTQNSVDKVFDPESLRTVNEFRQEVATPEFHTTWLEKNQGKDRNKTKKTGGGAGSAGTGRPGLAGANANASPKKSLFAKG